MHFTEDEPQMAEMQGDAQTRNLGKGEWKSNETLLCLSQVGNDQKVGQGETGRDVALLELCVLRRS